jgi:hypothetical protein
MNTFLKISTALAGLTAAVAAFSGVANASTCTGTCGVLGPNGVVTASPDGGDYRYVSTAGGPSGAGQIAGVGGTNGSLYKTDTFSAAAGDVLQFYFNYVTSDGAGFADYGWAELQDTASNHIAWLFTGRTKPSGNISPGFGLPANDATLVPATSGIIGGGPAWSPLAGDSGKCFSSGCGYTGWIQSVYTIANPGNYVLAFGVTNWSDSIWHSGLAFDGAKVGGVVIDPTQTPIPAALPLLIGALGGAGALGRRKAKAKAA